jgi:proteasome lid subunit RPN8/RPN11
VNYQSKMASILQATSHFRFLNDPGVRCGPQEFSIADRGANAVAEVEEVKALMQKCKPYGPTPLTHHLVEIGQRIAVMESRMRRKGLEAVVVLATDGLPTSLEGDTSPQINEEFVKALQYLQSLPVWVVVRLCTDERKVVNFYNELDNILELPLEVLDDFFNEAKEVHTHNKWLNYGLPLHRSREIGYHHRLFDLLDERPLNKDEIKEFCGILFGADQFAKAPDVHEDWKGFVNLVRTAVKAEELQFNPMTRKVGPWVDVKQLQKAFGGGISRLFCKSG